jgi:flavin reductase (DIM6/NTAB) family NADH-FMN oxidoreductase RutF
VSAAHLEPYREPSSDVYRLAVGRLATGVTIVTSRLGTTDHAMTANALASVSLEPLLVLVCVEREARFHDAIVESGLWGVIILPSTARATADWLATRGRPLHGQLERVPTHRGVTGVALLDESLSTLECETTDAYPGGDHTIVVGRVVAVEISDHAGDALVYYRGRYDTLA